MIKLEITKLLTTKCLFTHVESMLKVFGKSILNGVFEQIHLLTKKYSKYQNTKYSIYSISNTAHLCRWREVVRLAAHSAAAAAATVGSRALNYVCQRCLSTLKQRRQNYVRPTERATGEYLQKRRAIEAPEARPPSPRRCGDSG